MDQPSYFQALILLRAAGTAMYQRRKMEMMCGYPSDYGGDEKVLEKINEFLEDSYIKHDLTDAIKFVELLKEGK